MRLTEYQNSQGKCDTRSKKNGNSPSSRKMCGGSTGEDTQQSEGKVRSKTGKIGTKICSGDWHFCLLQGLTSINSLK